MKRGSSHELEHSRPGSLVGVLAIAGALAKRPLPARAKQGQRPITGAPKPGQRPASSNEPRNAPTTDAGFAAYAHQMTGDRRNLLPGYRRFRAFPNLRPAREWVWYGKALYADRHRQSHPLINPTAAQKRAMAQRAATLLAHGPGTRVPAGRPITPRGPITKRAAAVRGYVGSLGTNEILDSNSKSGYVLWHVNSGDLTKNDFYAIYFAPLGSTTAPVLQTQTTNDSSGDLANMQSQLATLRTSESARGSATGVTFAPDSPPPGSPAGTPVGTPAGGGGGGGGAVLVNSIPGEEGQAVGGPLTPEELAMDAAVPGSNIDPTTGLWVTGTTGPTADYLASHPASVTVAPGGATPGAPPPGMPSGTPPDAQPDPGTGFNYSPSTGTYYDPGTGQAASPPGQPPPPGMPYGGGGYPGGYAPVNVPPGTPQGQQYGGAPSPADYGYPPSDDGSYPQDDGGAYSPDDDGGAYADDGSDADDTSSGGHGHHGGHHGGHGGGGGWYDGGDSSLVILVGPDGYPVAYRDEMDSPQSSEAYSGDAGPTIYEVFNIEDGVEHILASFYNLPDALGQSQNYSAQNPSETVIVKALRESGELVTVCVYHRGTRVPAAFAQARLARGTVSAGYR